MTPIPLDRRQVFLGATLFLLLVGLYWLTYRGFPLSADEYFIYDVAESIVKRGEFTRTYEFSKFNDTLLTGAPWGAPLQEPLMSILVAPLFALGHALPDTGTLQVAWLTSIWLTALTAVSVYVGGRLLGYPNRMAWITGLIYGAGTLAWPYSRHLFREPLMTFFILWCFIFALMIRRAWPHGDGLPWRPGMLLIGAFVGAFLTKSASILTLPALAIIVLPPLDQLMAQRRRLLAIGAVALVIGGIMALVVGSAGAIDRYSLDFWEAQLRDIEWQFLGESLLGYHLSVGRSIWLYSPVLLVSLAGAWQLWRSRREWQTVTGVALFVVLLSASYGIAHETSWWGSWGWGPRYMLPLIPVLMIAWMLPAFEAITRRWQVIAVAGLAVIGAGLQLLGMSVRLSNYYTDLNWDGILTDWQAQPTFAPYNWEWRWSPIKYHLDRLDFANLDFAWSAVSDGWVGVVGALIWIVLSAAFALWLLQRDRDYGLASFGVSGLSIGAILVVSVGFSALRDDPRFIGEYTDVANLIEAVEPHVHLDDAVFIDRDLYLDLFLNWFKAGDLVAVLPYAPGEDFGSGPEIASDDLDEQVGAIDVYTLDWTAEHYERLWLIASSGPFEPDKRRPIERYLVTNHFPVQEINVPALDNPDAASQRARAIQFSSAEAPTGDPAQATSLVFGDVLSLEGFDLPEGITFSPGEIIPVSLVWSPVDDLPDDYNVSVQLSTLDGFTVAQRDGQPQATFGRMSTWDIGETYRDNHGLLVPPDLVPGDYIIQVIVYRWQDGTRLIVNGNDVQRLASIAITPSS